MGDSAYTVRKLRVNVRFARGAILVAGLSAAPLATAFDVNLGTSGLSASLFTDLRYNIGVRVEERNPAVANSASGGTSYSQSDWRFDRGDVVTNRLDATPQFELKYEPSSEWLQGIGIRASGNAFKDFAYHSDALTCRPGTAPVSTPALSPAALAGLPVNFIPAVKFPDDTVPGRVSYCDPRVLSYSSGHFNAEAKKSAFQDAEWLEGFAYGNFFLGELPLSLKIGRHALFWGEALLNPVLGVGYSMSAFDLNKQLTVPGAAAQDLLRPVNQASGTLGVTDTVSVGFQYFLGWEGIRAPEGGTFLGLADFINKGPDQLFVANLPGFGPLTLKHFPDGSGDNKHKFGVQAKWSPDFMDGGTFGAYYRRFDDIVPWFTLVPNPGNPLIPQGYRLVYAQDTRLYGLSASKKILDLSIGADVTYVPNRTLVSQQSLADASGQRARGEVWSGVVNAFYLGNAFSVPFTDWKVWDGSALIVETNWSYLAKVTQRPETYKGVGTPACQADIRGALGPNAPGETIDGCASRYSVGISLAFVPTWFQVFPGIDMNGGIAYARGLRNNSPANFGGNEGSVSGKVSVGATFYNKVSANLAYNFYDSQFRTGPNLDGEPSVTTNNGLGNISDRDWASLTLKYSF